MLEALLLIVGLVVGAIVGVLGGKFVAGQSIASAKSESENILATAKTQGETLAKQIELDARNEQAKRRDDLAAELDKERDEIDEKERRLAQREDLLDRKLETLAGKEKLIAEMAEDVKQRETKVKGKQETLDELLAKRETEDAKHEDHKKHELLRIGRLSEEDAKREAMTLLQQQCQAEAGEIVKAAQEKAQEDARENAQKVLLEAIQRFAGEHTAESTTNAVQIEDDAMKGRVIGREGRNIRAFEQATGVDVVVDDTPGVIIVSCFDPVRRAAASHCLRSMLKDGRIHPARIEEAAEESFKLFDEKIAKYGKDAALEINLPGMHPKVNETMGRLHYRTSYGQNILRHSIEVGALCQVIADELGLDGQLARRCGYLHDIGKALDHDTEGGHPKIGADFLRKHGEKNEAVLNAVEGHHNDIPSTTPYTPIVMAADAISGARPGARRETLEKYIKRLKELEEIARKPKGVKEAFAVQAGREVRIIVDPDRVDDAACHAIARDIAQTVSDEMTFPGEIKVTVLREIRTIDYAR
ncbi:MAG: ribonuclease Y [Planctomycetota bacterium]